MATGKSFAIFVLPAIVSVALASVVMLDILDKSDRELVMWPAVATSSGEEGGTIHLEDTDPAHRYDRLLFLGEERGTIHLEDTVKILGLNAVYPVDSQVEVRIAVDDSSFDCGDLYITIYSGGDVIGQNGFFDQCFAQNNTTIPVDDIFTYVADTPGVYQIAVSMISDDLDTVEMEEEFTVR